MTKIELNDALFAKLAGWQVVKHARTLLEAGRVCNSEWNPPTLRGMVQEGGATYRAGLVIKSASDAENLCTCRDARQRGIICAHSIAVGMHHLRGEKSVPAPVVLPAGPKPSTAKSLRRAGAGEPGEPLELCFILPPNLLQAAEKGRVMLCVEGQWRKGRSPLNALPLDVPFTLPVADATLAGS
jgi:hypothetical protein